MKVLLKALCLISLAGLVACSSTRSQRTIEEDRAQVQVQLESEISLKSDRDKFAELREEIPKDKQRTNDELALFLQLLGQGNEVPGSVRDKFQALVAKRRTQFRDKVTKIRESFNKDQRHLRDSFTAEQKAKRSEFIARRHDAAASRTFFSEQDKQRLAFNAEERERRDSFESEVRGQSKDFESYMRERTAEFNEQHRIYSRNFYDIQKEKKASENARTGAGEFSDMNKVPATSLSTED